MPTEVSAKPKRVQRFVPAYVTVSEDVRKKIRTGQWSPGIMLPGRRDLAKTYGVDIGTMQKAMGLLLDEGLLRAEDRRGTFVAERPVIQGDYITVPIGKPLRESHDSAGPGTATMVVGVVARYYFSHHNHIITGAWPVGAVHALERTLAEEAAVMVRCATEHLPDGAAVSLDRQVLELKQAGVNALVMIFAEGDEVNQLLHTLGQEIPVVCVCSYDMGPAASHVFYDSRYAGYQAAKHLSQQGWDDLLFVAPFELPFVGERLHGVRQFLEAAHASASVEASIQPVTSPSLIEDQWAAFGGYVHGLVDRLPGRGVIAANDTAAFHIMDAAAAQGLVPGRDYGIIGFDDQPGARGRGLTTLHPPIDSMGAEAARIVLGFLKGGRAARQVRLHSHLIPRASTTARVMHNS